MSRRRRFSASVAMMALVAGCGGGGGGSAGGGGGGTVVVPPTTPPATAGCSLSDRQSWVAAQLNEWYLFPDLIATGVNPAAFSDINDYVDALVAPARAQNRDRFFTYVTSIAEEDAFFNSGSSAGFGVRLSTDVAARRLFIAEAFESAPALAAGIDRGTEILAIGTSAANLRTVDSIIASEGSAGITNALGPSTAGTTRVLRVRDSAGTREVSVAKADFTIAPVSSRYGAQIINDGARRVGYVNLRTFINTADPALRSAFSNFRAQGITEVIVDFRYNGGGLVSIAELMNDLLLNRPTSTVGAVVALDPGGFWVPWEGEFVHATLTASGALLRALRPALPTLAHSAAARTALLAQLSARPWGLNGDLVEGELLAITRTATFQSLVSDLAFGAPQEGPAAPPSGPVTIGWGRHDRLTLPAQAKRALVAFPGARLHWFDHSGHFPMFDEPDATIALIREATAHAST